MPPQQPHVALYGHRVVWRIRNSVLVGEALCLVWRKQIAQLVQVKANQVQIEIQPLKFLQFDFKQVHIPARV